MSSRTVGAPEAAIELRPQKPLAISAGSVFGVIAPASPAERDRIDSGIKHLQQLNFRVAPFPDSAPEDYFASATDERKSDFLHALGRQDVQALVATRGGYGSNYLLDDLHLPANTAPKILLGYSDLTSLQYLSLAKT